MSFFTAMSLTFQPLRRLGELSGIWQVAGASLSRIYALLDRAPHSIHPEKSAALPAGALDIQFDDVHFAYGGTPVLRGVSFAAAAGKTTAFVGTSGAGKSTLFQLLTGLIDPAQGRVLVGGVDTATLSLPDLRGLFASVSQDAALFDETVRDNIVLGRTVAAGKLTAAISSAQMDDFLGSLPKGVNSPVGPRGSSLSGGQRQRVAIARALIADAPILLLDEATSALDAGSEGAVARSLEAARAGRTTLVIAHRLATVRNADKIIVLDQGVVAEQGTHEALLAQGGIYAGLCALQFTQDFTQDGAA
jgi:ATP-binding cassette subfamily B protein/subfamily B ATP-binding cassette protein MsbA